MSEVGVIEIAERSLVEATEITTCHIDDGSELRAYCGAPDAEGPITCSVYGGESNCDTCGKPMCPVCVAMCSLAERLGSE